MTICMMFNAKLKIFTFAVMIFFIASGLSYAEASFKLLYLDQADATIVSSQEKVINKSVKNRIGSVSFGHLFGHKFYTTRNHNELFVTDLETLETEVLLDFKNVMAGRYYPLIVDYVDDNKIIIEAYTYDNTKPIGKDMTFYIFQFDRRAGNIKNTPINFDRGPVSVYGERIYYTGKDGDIYCYDGSAEQSLKIKGKSPTISPDGTRLAYIFSGWVTNDIHIYDIKTKKTQSVISFFNLINPIIRWSGDSGLIAMKTLNDLYATPLYIVDSLTGEIVRKFNRTYAHNWFFVDDAW